MEVKLARWGKYIPGILTNEHPGSSGGLLILVIDGEKQFRRPNEVYCVRVGDQEMAQLARKSGYQVLTRRLRRRNANINNKGQVRMLVAAILLLTLLTASPCLALDKWSTEDYTLEATWIILHTLDWGTTLDISDHPDRYYEINPILGRHPSRGAVHAWMLGSTLAHIGIVHVLPKSYRQYFQGCTIAISGALVTHSFNIGLSLAF